MLAEGLKSFSDISLTVAGMVLFMLVFVSVFVKTYFPGSRREQDDAALLPLISEENSRD